MIEDDLGNFQSGKTGLAVLLPAVLTLGALCNCSAVVDSDRVQCSSKEDCEKRQGPFVGSECIDNFCARGPWSCLGHVTWPAATAGSVNVTLNLVDIITSQPVTGLTVQACRKLDTSCASPLITDIASDDLGRMTFTAPAGFDGYLQSTSTGIMPFLYFFYPPVTSDREVPAIPVLQASALATFATLAGTTIMPARGHVMARSYDCLGATAAGIRYSSVEGDEASTPFYMIKGIPSTKHTATDGSGNGGLVNLPPGSATLTGSLENGGPVGTISVLTVAGKMTYTALVPAPQ